MAFSCMLHSRNFHLKNQNNNMQTCLQNHSSLSEKKYIIANCKNYKGCFRWYCQVCGLKLTSKIQAQEHFFGKRHQNVVRNKGFYNEYNSDLKTHNQIHAGKKNVDVRFQNPSKSSFNQNFGFGFRISEPENDSVLPPAARDNILETVIKSEKRTFYSSDLSIYRTPSGKYYCQLCNITVNSQVQFLQHLQSKKHKHKVNRSSPSGK